MVTDQFFKIVLNSEKEKMKIILMAFLFFLLPLGTTISIAHVRDIILVNQ